MKKGHYRVAVNVHLTQLGIARADLADYIVTHLGDSATSGTMVALAYCGGCTMYRIRYATASDNTLLAAVGAETFYDSFAADNTPENMAAYLATSFSPEKQAQELADPASRFLIAEVEGATVGYARLKFGEAPTAVAGQTPMEIVRFYARKPWLSKGVGAQLMQACLREAKRAGSGVVWLDVWERNTRAIAFYHRWGFVQVGTQAFQLGGELQRDLVMARAVSLDVA